MKRLKEGDKIMCIYITTPPVLLLNGVYTVKSVDTESYQKIGDDLVSLIELPGDGFFSSLLFKKVKTTKAIVSDVEIKTVSSNSLTKEESIEKLIRFENDLIHKLRQSKIEIDKDIETHRGKISEYKNQLYGK